MLRWKQNINYTSQDYVHANISRNFPGIMRIWFMINVRKLLAYLNAQTSTVTLILGRAANNIDKGNSP